MWPAQDLPSHRQASSTPDMQHSPSTAHGYENLEPQQSMTPTAGSIDGFGRLMNNGNIPTVPDLNIRDLELMLHWCTSTYTALSRDDTTREIWKEVIPEEAVKHPFLMHGMLALSALHIARLSSDKRRAEYMAIAVGHQNRALALFRPLLRDVNASNCNATFALSSIVTVFAFAFTQPSGPMGTLAAVDDLCQVFLLARGMQHILNASLSWVMDGKLRPLLTLEDHNSGLPDDARLALQRLGDLNDAMSASDQHHERDVYGKTISLLEDVLDRLYNNPKKPNIAVMFAIKIPERYIGLLREHKPMALVVLAHYSVILHHLRQHWWFEGWSVRVLGAIWSNMNAEWRSSISWAMDVARSDVSIVPPGDMS